MLAKNNRIIYRYNYKINMIMILNRYTTLLYIQNRNKLETIKY